MQTLKDLLFATRCYKPQEITTQRRSFSAGNIPNLTNYVLAKSKSISLFKITSNVSTSDVPIGSIKFHKNEDELEPKKTKRKLQETSFTNQAKKHKHDEENTDESINEKEYKSVTLRLSKNEILGLEIFPKWKNTITGYYILNILPDSIADRNKTLKIGDEIVKVNGSVLSQTKNPQAFFTQKEGNLELIIARNKTLTGMRKFTLSDSPHKTNRLPTFTERYCNLTGTLYISIRFYKGGGAKKLGFSIVGGRDYSKMGIFIKNIFDNSQASDLGILKEGDEIIAVNGKKMNGLNHYEAVETFKNIKNGYCFVELIRKNRYHKNHSF